jgi:hypothetical protein
MTVKAFTNGKKTIFAGVAIVLIATTVLAAGGHLFDHEKPLRQVEKEFYKKIETCNADLSSKIERLTEAVNKHVQEGGIHQTPKEKEDAQFKTAVEVVDSRIARLMAKMESLQEDLNDFITTEREAIIERLLKVETQQVRIIEKMEELKAELRKR